MNIAIIQARVSSTRLPGKVLKPILGLPMFIRQLERIKRCKHIDRIILATSIEPSDDQIEQIAREHNVSIFRGSLHDVLDRYYQAARLYQPRNIIRITADCPLIDPEIIDETIQFHQDGGFDYTSNSIEPTFPDGLDTEVFRFWCLETAWKEAELPSQREHVTPFIRQAKHRFKIGSFKHSENYSHLRWTVDEAEDYELVCRIYEALYPTNPEFSYWDIITYLKEHPEVMNINANVDRNKGYQKSLEIDREYLKKRNKTGEEGDV